MQKSDFSYGKIPPQAKEMEAAVLGACMIEKGAFDGLSDVLQADCFYVEAHKTVFEAMQQLSADNQPIDLLVSFPAGLSAGVCRG